MRVEKWWNEGRGKTGEKPTQTYFHPLRNPHVVTETRTRDPQRLIACLQTLYPYHGHILINQTYLDILRTV